MQISSNFSLSGVQALKGSTRSNPAQATEAVAETASLTPVDQLDLSPEAQGLGGVESSNSSSSDIRTDKVAALRRAIADGNYDTPERISAALDNFLNQLG